MRILGILLFAGFLFLISSTAVWAGNNCFQCHDKKDFGGKYVHRPVAEGACQKCHNPHVAKYKGLLGAKQTELCFECHADLKKNKVDKIIVHKPFAAADCVACHDPHSSGQKGLLMGGGKGCFKCHKEMDGKYKNMHAPFAAGNCGACHNAHYADRFQLLIDAPDQLCVGCHRDGLSSAHKGFPVKVKESGCLTCHNPHGSDRPGLVRNVLHEPYQNDCSECHKEGRAVGVEKCLGCHDEMGEKLNAIHNHQTSKSGNGCTNCHSPHASDFDNLLRNKQDQLCRKCHTDTWATYVDKPHKHPDSSICSSCHDIHGSNEVAMLKGDGNAVCNACHETQGQFTHPVGEGVIDPRNSQIMTCVSCHYPHGTLYEYNLKLSGSMELCIQCHQEY